MFGKLLKLTSWGSPSRSEETDDRTSGPLIGILSFGPELKQQTQHIISNYERGKWIYKSQLLARTLNCSVYVDSRNRVKWSAWNILLLRKRKPNVFCGGADCGGVRGNPAFGSPDPEYAGGEELVEDGEVVKHGDTIPASAGGCKRFGRRLLANCQSRRPEILVNFAVLAVPI